MNMDPLGLQWRLDKLYDKNPFVDPFKGVKMPTNKPSYGWTMTVKETAYFMSAPCRGKVMTKTCVFSSMVDSSKKEDETSKDPFQRKFDLEEKFGKIHGSDLSMQFVSTQTTDAETVSRRDRNGIHKTHHSSTQFVGLKCQRKYFKEVIISVNGSVTLAAKEQYALGGRWEYKNDETGWNLYAAQDINKIGGGEFSNITKIGGGYTGSENCPLFGISGLGVSAEVSNNFEEGIWKIGGEVQYKNNNCTIKGNASYTKHSRWNVGVEGKVDF